MVAEGKIERYDHTSETRISYRRGRPVNLDEEEKEQNKKRKNYRGCRLETV